MRRPNKGEIYRIHIQQRSIDVLVYRVRDNRVYFATLGRGRESSYPLSVFELTAEYVETRLERLRRACQRYRLKETDRWLGGK